MAMSDRYDGYVSPTDLLNNAQVSKMVEEYQFDIDKIKEILLNVYEITLNKFYSKSVFNQGTNKKEENPDRRILKGRVEELIFRTKSYTLLNPKTLEYISEAINSNPTLLDFVLSIRTSFFARMDIPEIKQKSFFDKLARFVYIPNNDKSIISKNILDRISPFDKDTLSEVLQNNDILVPIVLINILLSISDLESL